MVAKPGLMNLIVEFLFATDLPMLLKQVSYTGIRKDTEVCTAAPVMVHLML
jgi:hypothetical protein